MKQVLITGASAGIGEAIAREFASHGHDLLLVARRAEQLQALADDLQAAHDIKVDCCPLDLSAPDAIDSLLQHVDAGGREVDVVVNNAGVLFDGPFADIPLRDHLLLLQVNNAALVAVTHGFLQRMRAQGGGRIINICSTSAFQPVPKLAVYAASKAFVLSFSEALALELRGSGVSVTAICPGFTRTGMVDNLEDGQLAALADRVALTPEQVAEETYDAGMSGRVLHINGLFNRTSANFMQALPRSLKRALAAAMTGKQAQE